MPNANKNQLVTIGDLEDFKLEIITAVERAIKSSKGLKNKKWLKSSEVGKLIGVSPGKLKTIRDTGLISYTKIGGSIYYAEEDIIKLFEGNKKPIK